MEEHSIQYSDIIDGIVNLVKSDRTFRDRTAEGMSNLSDSVRFYSHLVMAAYPDVPLNRFSSNMKKDPEYFQSLKKSMARYLYKTELSEIIRKQSSDPKGFYHMAAYYMTFIDAYAQVKAARTRAV